MTYRGWVLHNVALGSTSAQAAQLDEQAMQWLDQAVTTDPTYADARVFRASDAQLPPVTSPAPRPTSTPSTPRRSRRS